MSFGNKITFIIVDRSGGNDCGSDDWDVVVDVFDGDVDDGEVDDGVGGEVDQFNHGADSRKRDEKRE